MSFVKTIMICPMCKNTIYKTEKGFSWCRVHGFIEQDYKVSPVIAVQGF